MKATDCLLIGSGIGTWWDRPTGCRGFVGPVPPPLWMIALHETRHWPQFQKGPGLGHLATRPPFAEIGSPSRSAFGADRKGRSDSPSWGSDCLALAPDMPSPAVRTFNHREFAVDRLVEAKGTQRISMVLPARNEAPTI